MTETGGIDEGAHSPLKGKSPEKTDGKMDVDAPPPADDNKKDNEVASTSGAASPPPSAVNKMDSSCFKTPEPLTPTSSAKKRKRLTPEEKNLREKERQEKRRKLEEEKQRKEQERLEKARQKEEEKLRKEEEKRRQEEEKRLERLKKEEEKKKQEEEKRQERLKKEEEKRKFEEEKLKERMKKEEEKKKKEEERRQKLEEKEREQKKLEEKKAKQAQFFTNFFQKSTAPKVQIIEDGNVYLAPSATTNIASDLVNEKSSGSSVGGAPDVSKNAACFNPLPFQIKTDMAIAPLVRREKLSDQERLEIDSLFEDSAKNVENTHNTNFLKTLKDRKARTSGRTEVKYAKDNEIQVIDDNTEKPKCMSGYIKWRIKLLQFHENRRPAYWGTWKRNPKRVAARRPFAREEELDYDFDSDDEWEDEPEDAEEIVDSDKEEKEDQEDGDEEDEEGWMVPHGYLSDSEREGPHVDLESMKCKEKEFYKSLKKKNMMEFPFIETTNLKMYAIRTCPVFRYVEPVKPVRKRKPKQKIDTKVEEKEVSAADPPKPETKLAPPESPVGASKSSVAPVSERKSKRTPKAPKANNPYAHAPSGFLAMELPSDDEDDMDWEGSSHSSSSSEVDSDHCNDEIDEDENQSDYEDSSSDEDLFIPIPKKPKTSG